jgi:hypothetical protein
MAFQVNGSPPPAHCKPRSPGNGGSYERFMPAEAPGMTGEGVPLAAVGYPSYEVFFDALPLAGWTFYSAFVGEGPYAALTSLQVWNPYEVVPGVGEDPDTMGAYVTFTHAHIQRPTYERMVWGGLAYENVRIRFTELHS